MPLPEPRPERAPAPRPPSALRTTAELVVPGAVATGLLWVLVPGQYVAAKALLASWGIPPITGALLAPIALGSLIWGVRWAWRTFAPPADGPDR